MSSSASFTALFAFKFLLFSISITSCNGDFSEELLEAMTLARMEKTTLLHFYFQDVVSGKNATAVQIIGKELGFGATYIVDDALTQDPDPNSKVIGRAQGIYSAASQNDVALLMVLTLSFTNGKYNGSSISVLGRNHVFDNVREMPVVGGSGLFRLSRGYALAHTLRFDPKTGDACVEYNVTVKHF